VIIAILATITLMAYNGIQQRARDSSRDTAVSTIRKALEMYIADNGTYPNACNSTTAGCNVSQLATYLVPTYVSSVPNDPNISTPVNYVVNGSFTGYGLLVKYESKPQCKYLGGSNANDTNNGWWGTSVPKC
jgi:type II secretory pathway pseudopilin PulG